MIRSSLVIACMLVSAAASAKSTNYAEGVALATQKIVTHSVTPLVGFKVGDTCNYNLSLASMPGTMVMTITAVSPTGLTIDQKVDLGALGQEDVVTVIDPKTGDVISITANGQKQTPPAPGDTKVTSETPTKITVAAGTFNCEDIKTHTTSDNSDAEQWVDVGGAVPVGGMLKMATTSQGMPVTAALQSFAVGK